MRSQLDQAQKLEAVGQLAAGVAHEINTPIQYVGDSVRFVRKTFVKLQAVLEAFLQMDESEVNQLAVDDLPTAKFVKNALIEIPEGLDDAMSGAKKVAKIVAAMKEFSHPGGEEKSAVSVNHIIESAVTVASNEWKYSADLNLDLDPELPELLGLHGELNQAFLNILINASHAVAARVNDGAIARGLIEIKSKKEGDGLLVTIKDTGGGIPESIQSCVFDPFFTTKEVGKGTGQGLAIAYNVINDKHGGRIWFEVEEGEGTTFFIHLPISYESGGDSQ